METIFRAMNTNVHVTVEDVPAFTDWEYKVHNLFLEIEEIASRFKVNSELSRWNASPIGKPYLLTKQFYNLLAYAWECAVQTDFKFNPLVGTVLNEMGYDRSFEKLERVKQEIDRTYPLETTPMEDMVGLHALSFLSDQQMVTKHKQVIVDLGGIGKGWTVDLAYRLLRDELQFQAGAIDAGGDIRVWSDGEPWQVGIQHPTNEEQELIQLWVKQGGIATSNVMYRRWIHLEHVYHHIIDGQTLQAANTDVVQATVLAPSTALAEVVSKVICMLQASEVNEWVSSHLEGVGYIFITKSGEIKLNREVKNYIEELKW
ncbi:FAD:protein FMN transferase [Paenibacillus marinisediminis]